MDENGDDADAKRLDAVEVDNGKSDVATALESQEPHTSDPVVKTELEQLEILERPGRCVGDLECKKTFDQAGNVTSARRRVGRRRRWSMTRAVSFPTRRWPTARRNRTRKLSRRDDGAGQLRRPGCRRDERPAEPLAGVQYNDNGQLIAIWGGAGAGRLELDEIKYDDAGRLKSWTARER